MRDDWEIFDLRLFDWKLAVWAFEAGFAVEGDDVRPVDGTGNEIFTNGVVADVAEFFGVMCIVAEAGVEEVLLERHAEMFRHIVFPMLHHVR